MTLLVILAILYLLAGFVYAVYILANGIEPIQTFPLNVLAGPLVYLFNIYMLRKGKLP
jgi:hypothetical protein